MIESTSERRTICAAKHHALLDLLVELVVVLANHRRELSVVAGGACPPGTDGHGKVLTRLEQRRVVAQTWGKGSSVGELGVALGARFVNVCSTAALEWSVRAEIR